MKDDDFSTFARLMNEDDAVAYRHRQRPPKIKPETVLRRCTLLRDALRAWATTFNADALWFLDETLRTLRGWYVDPGWRAALKWNPISGVSSTIAIGEPFHFECEGWEMQLITWPAYSKSIGERFERKLAEYEAASRKLAESRGLIRVPHKYSTKNIDWFVLYQFAGLPSTEVARRDPSARSTDESTVLKGVKAAAKLLGWGHLRSATRTANRKIR